MQQIKHDKTHFTNPKDPRRPFAVNTFRIREVLIPTVNEAGSGDDFAFPCELDYSNPIHAIRNKPGSICFKFETKDGAVSMHPNSTRQF